MKVAFWIVFVLAGALGLSASCGPERPFCPDREWDEFNCAVESDGGALGGQGGGGGGSVCQPGYKYEYVDGKFMCIPE